jgi:hypothetical protein
MLTSTAFASLWKLEVKPYYQSSIASEYTDFDNLAAAELIVPETLHRNSKASGRGDTLDYFYDKQHFNWSLSTYCPQMKLYWSIDDLYNTPMGNPLPLSANDMGMDLIHESILMNPWNFLNRFRDYFEMKSNPKTRTWPFKFNVGTTLYTWPSSHDPSDFVRNFGRILRIRTDARQLAASATLNLQKVLKTSDSPNLKKGGLKGFVAIQLRTEKDGPGLGFPPLEEQTAYYLDYIVQSQYSLAYLAPGSSKEDTAAFIKKAREVDITVLTKKDLLDPVELQYLAKLTADQQALVDYEVMLRADLTAGACESAFAWNVALRRAAAAGLVGGSPLIPQTGHVRWQDRKSVVMGKDVDKNMNMQLGIWP